LIQRLAGRVSKDGLLVLSWPGGTEPPVLDGVEQIDYRHYGDATLVFYRQNG
jgi:hypothetical protein